MGDTYGGEGIVVRWESRPFDASDVEWEHGAVAAVAAAVPEVVSPLRARDGSTWFSFDGRAVSVYPFVSGARAQRSREHAALAGAFVSRLQRAASSLVVAPPPRRPPLASHAWAAESPELPPPLVAYADAIAAARREGVAIVANLRGLGLQVGLIHNDLYPRNVLVRDDRIVALVDWAEARLDWLAYDLANAMWEFCHVGDELVEAHVGAFLGAYREGGGPVVDEDPLVPLIRLRRAVEVMQAARGDATDADYTLHNLRALELLP